MPEIFPGRKEVPKTLIFAKTDSHADDIIQIVREEFAESNNFCKKITYKAEEDPKSVLAQFRNNYNPRIAVTVDMIATGTDVKPLECLIFMRGVRSKNYFEQMKGRGTRTINLDDLKKVTPSANFAKDHFVIVDAIGVTKSLKTDSRPLDKKPSVPLKDLLNAVTVGAKGEELYSTLASRLSRLDKQLTEKEQKKLLEKTDGVTLNQIVKNLLNAYDPDKIEKQARAEFDIKDNDEPTSEQLKEVKEKLVDAAASVFNGELNEFIENVRKAHEQIIDSINIDKVEFAGWDKQAKDKSIELVESFKAYIQENKDEITALQIFYNQPYRRREVTFSMVKELLEKIKEDKPSLAPLRVWQAYEALEKVNGDSPKDELVALVSLIRRITNIDEVLTPYDKVVNKNFQDWVFKKQAGVLKFTEEQMEWLRMVKDQIATSFHMDVDDFDYEPFDAKGGLGKMWQLFGKKMHEIVDELNEGLVS
ncbi:type I restriction-modification enzyme R subunit C-terminal domain-containing protein [Clostridium tyrobutyricum]|uniref:type I restriction-modification enzyme R subunit C-terminal domain-containing protein n=1 Tax=Clostridium tyrobutyricum TaxID=1519 RepID=UPI000B27EA14|nr:type I restriction-modification enzyme R subunit C-terminal domain-containing protein [Clostridium tyrobutyricum]